MNFTGVEDSAKEMGTRPKCRGCSMVDTNTSCDGCPVGYYFYHEQHKENLGKLFEHFSSLEPLRAMLGELDVNQVPGFVPNFIEYFVQRIEEFNSLHKGVIIDESLSESLSSLEVKLAQKVTELEELQKEQSDLTVHISKLGLKDKYYHFSKGDDSSLAESTDVGVNVAAGVGSSVSFEPQEPFSTFKSSYVSGMWRTLCECITESSAESSESLKELEKGVAFILKGLREVITVDLSPLEALLKDFFKKHRDYNAARLSISEKMTRDSHLALLSAAQQPLHTANEEKIKVDKHLGELQKDLARAEKELEVWTSKKKKIISLIEEHQIKLSKYQESIANSEDEIHAIEKISPLSETEIKGLAKLKEDAETSRHQILSHKLFP